MTSLEAIIYGIVQGITEFLPVSSSGHLALAHNFFGVEGESNIGFVVLLHLATLFAVFFVYYKEVFLIIKSFFTLLAKLFTGRINQGLSYGEKLFLMLVIASLPLIPMSFLADRVEYISGVSWVIGMLLIINGSMLYLADKFSKGKEGLEQSDYQKPFFVGLFQVFGVLPGISRSGSTITGGLVFGFNRQDAVKLSFLMSIPAILGACVFKLPAFFKEGITDNMLVPSILGSITAAVVGFFAIKLLQYIARNRGFGFFSIYCIIIGTTAIIADIL